MGEEN